MSVHTFEGFIHVVTPRAIAFQGHYWDGKLWLPKSQIEIVEDGDTFVVIHVKDWLAKKRGLLEFTAYSAEQIEEINTA